MSKQLTIIHKAENVANGRIVLPGLFSANEQTSQARLGILIGAILRMLDPNRTMRRSIQTYAELAISFLANTVVLPP